jgi:hypothetical protein
MEGKKSLEMVNAASDRNTLTEKSTKKAMKRHYSKYEFCFEVIMLSPIILVIIGVFLLPTILYGLSSVDQVRNQLSMLPVP